MIPFLYRGPRFIAWCRRCEKECDEVETYYSLAKLGMNVRAVCHKEKTVHFVPDEQLANMKNYSVGGDFFMQVFKPKGEGK